MESKAIKDFKKITKFVGISGRAHACIVRQQISLFSRPRSGTATYEQCSVTCDSSAPAACAIYARADLAYVRIADSTTSFAGWLTGQLDNSKDKERGTLKFARDRSWSYVMLVRKFGVFFDSLLCTEIG